MNSIFVGEKRSGKTTLAFEIANRYEGGIIVFDPKKEFRDWPATVYSIPELENAIDKKNTVIIYRPTDDPNTSIEASWEPLADWIMARHAIALKNGWDRAGLNFTLLLDEAYNLQSHHWINEKLLKILSECRPEVLNVFQTFQSIKNVNSDSRSRVSDWYLFTITLPSDLKRLEEFAMPEVVEQVQNLGEHEYVHFLNEKGKQNFEVETDPALWFRPLDYVKPEEEDFMAKDDERNREEHEDDFPKEGIRIFGRDGLDEANEKYNRRRGTPENYKGDRTRKSDRKDRNKSGERGRSGNEIVFGKKSA